MVFPFSAFGRFNFDPRELSIESIDDTERKSCDESHPDMAKHKSRSCRTTDDEACNRNLVWRDSRFAKKRDYRGLDWRVDVSWKIQSALLRRIQNNAFSDTTLPWPRRRKTEWPHMPAHADDVIVNFCRVQDVDLTGLALLLELLENRRAVRARQKELPRH